MSNADSPPLATHCAICRNGYTPTAKIVISNTPTEGEFPWAHKSCWVERESKSYLKFESTQYYEGQFGFVSSHDHQHQSLDQRNDLPEERRISASSIDWEPFLIRLYDLIRHETDATLGAVYVIGSLANNEAVPGSDIDIIIGVDSLPLEAGSASQPLYRFWKQFKPLLIEEIEHPLSEAHIVHTTTVKKAAAQALSKQETPPTRQYYPAVIYDPILDVKWGSPRKAQNNQSDRNSWFESRDHLMMNSSEWQREKLSRSINTLV